MKQMENRRRNNKNDITISLWLANHSDKKENKNIIRSINKKKIKLNKRKEKNRKEIHFPSNY